MAAGAGGRGSGRALFERLQIAWQEPFRLFFPLGWLCGIAAVALWPLFYGGVIESYPGIAHARLMFQGMLAAFVIGFLGTAGPRLLSAGPLAAMEAGVLAAVYLAMAGAHFAGLTLIGDALFLVLLLTFIAVIGRRFKQREDLPPPAFVLVLFGIGSALAGTSILLASSATLLAPAVYVFGKLLLYQGFLLFPVLGIGTFLFPKFMGLPPRLSFPELRTPSPLWKREAWVALGAGFGILATFGLEALGWPRSAALARFAFAAAFVLRNTPILRRAGNGFFAGALKASVLLLLAGLLLPLFSPAHNMGWVHVLFIGGFALTTLLVATRVIFGHSGTGHLLKGVPAFLVATVALLLVGLLLRVGGEFAPTVRVPHINAASVAWMLALLVWGLVVLPKVVVPDPEG